MTAIPAPAGDPGAARERWPSFSESRRPQRQPCAPSGNCWTRCWRRSWRRWWRRWLAGYRAIAGDESAAPRAALLRRWLAGQQAPMPAREVPGRLLAWRWRGKMPALFAAGESTVRHFTGIAL